MVSVELVVLHTVGDTCLHGRKARSIIGRTFMASSSLISSSEEVQELQVVQKAWEEAKRTTDI